VPLTPFNLEQELEIALAKVIKTITSSDGCACEGTVVSIRVEDGKLVVEYEDGGT